MLLDFLLGNYKKVSDRLGLVIDGDSIRGVLDGVPLQIWFGAHSTHLGALLPRPAPIELSIVTTSLTSKLADLFRGHSGGIGDEAFDKTFSVKAQDPARVAGILNPDARKALLEAAKAGLHPAVDPHSVHLRRFSQGGLADSEEMIEHDFREAVRLAKVLGESFAGAYR
jgi:hypothetical protein